MKRLFLLFLLVISLTALYLSFVSCKDGFRPARSPFDLIKNKVTNTKNKFQRDKKTNARLKSGNK